jgi:hypothetical protein
MWLWPVWTKEPEPSVPAPPLTCADVVQLANGLDWGQWVIFLEMARTHDIDQMSRAEVEQLFNLYRQQQVSGHDAIPAGDPCTPRQLVEFIYMLSPPRWALFQEFLPTVDLKGITFHDILTKFCEYENSRALNE